MTAAHLEELYDLLRIPSVSADPSHAGDVRRAGEWVRDLVRSAKGGDAELVETDAQPLVIGEIPASRDPGSAPTVLVYGHFDVQPPAPIDLWESDPFEPTVKNDWLFARGVADDKGQLYSILRAAVDLADEGGLPVNIRVASDGEEEIGGMSIVDWVNDDERGADVCVIFDGGMERRDVPQFCTGTRGLVAFDITVKTGARDFHRSARARPGRRDDSQSCRAAGHEGRARRRRGRHPLRQGNAGVGRRSEVRRDPTRLEGVREGLRPRAAAHPRRRHAPDHGRAHRARDPGRAHRRSAAGVERALAEREAPGRVPDEGVRRGARALPRVRRSAAALARAQQSTSQVCP